MTLPTCLEPENARITIPVVLAIGYALYHWWRWRMMHPKIVLANLPEPSPEAVPAVAAPKDIPPSAANDIAGTETEPPNPRDQSVKSGAVHREFRWKKRFDEEKIRAKYDRESFDVYFHVRAYYKSTHGLPEYYVRLAEYAWRRGAMVETYYWLSMAKFKGVAGLDEWMEHVRLRWIRGGHLPESANFHEVFPVERMKLAHQYLLLVCGFSVQVNRQYLTHTAKSGNEEAQLILKHLDQSAASSRQRRYAETPVMQPSN